MNIVYTINIKDDSNYEIIMTEKSIEEFCDLPINGQLQLGNYRVTRSGDQISFNYGSQEGTILPSGTYGEICKKLQEGIKNYKQNEKINI
ncbi:hypothetical protein [Sulfurospirillum halorespirans]|uniref:hypothetical protein n=1 Tax=Sulfurospirillum halorespirans TaxID=194424 RepID=UPI000849EDE8|nr:hypothetical protein [Sulfurospirillum halorespirans]